MKSNFIATLLFFCLALVGSPHAQSQSALDPNSQIRWSTPIISTPGPQTKFLNNTPQADQFPGAPDVCLQVRNAEVYALNNSINQVDATHFSGTVACHTDMFNGLNPTGNASINLAVNFGAVHLQSTVGQSVTNSGLHIHGMGRYVSQLEYVGTSVLPQAIPVRKRNDWVGRTWSEWPE